MLSIPAGIVSRSIVYIIDNDDGFRRSLGYALRAEGLECITYASAAEFLDAAYALEAGVALVDLGMPGRDGLELLSHLRLRDLPITTVAVTGHLDPELHVEAVALRASRSLVKPFTLQQLIEAVEAA